MSTTDNSVQADKMNALFFPHFWERRKSLRESDRKLVHYTSAENAMRILSDKAMTMLSTVCMNDYSEVQHGHKLVHRCFTENDAIMHKQFVAAFDAVHPGAALEAFNTYDQHFKDNVFRTYITCLSEHDPKRESMGRLSMWRAYNQGGVGVALVVNKAPFFRNASASVGFFASPVAYLQDHEVKHYLQKVIDSAAQETEFLKTLTREQTVSCIFILLMFSAIFIKHHGFEEEQEWRIIHLPGLYQSTIITKSTLAISGVPQVVYKLPLADHPDQGLIGIEIPAFLDEIIIGPTQFPYPISEAFADVLSKAGVEKPIERIRSTNIPLRTWVPR